MTLDDKQIEEMKTLIKEAVNLTVEVDNNVMACDPSVWSLCAKVEEIDLLFKIFLVPST